MADIIIHKSDLIDDAEALRHVLVVVNDGRISNDGKCYCYVTTFTDGFIVYADKKKADIFTVTKRGADNG